MAHEKATQHLSIHALEGIRAKDGLVGAGEDAVRVKWFFPELLALVVAGQHWTRHYPAGGLALGFDEQKVKRLPFVQTGHESSTNKQTKSINQ